MKKCIFGLICVLLLISNTGLYSQQRYQLKKGDTVIIDGTEIVHNPKSVLKNKIQPVRSVNNTPDIIVEINHNYSGKGYTGGELAPNPSPISPYYNYVCDHSHCIPDEPKIQRGVMTYTDMVILVAMGLLAFIAYILWLVRNDEKEQRAKILAASSAPLLSPNISPINIHTHNNYSPTNENYSLSDSAKQDEKPVSTDKVE